MKILVVDPSSSGSDLVQILRSNPAVELYIIQPDWYVEVEPNGEIYDQRAYLLLDKYSELGLDAVVAGSEGGVVLAEYLAHHLGLPHNGFSKIWHRRNKQGMIDLAKDKGLRVPKSILVRPDLDLTDLRLPNSLSDQYIVKPASSGGSDQVTMCSGRGEVERAIDCIRSSVTLLGETAPAATIQEYIHGTQYFVNVVSSEGIHLVTEVFEYGIREVNGKPQIFSAITLDRSNERYKGAVEYTLALLDALDVNFGASHVELRYSDDGWVLIEYNGRCMGPEVPSDFYRRYRGYSQITVLADLLMEGIEIAKSNLVANDRNGHVGWMMPTPQSEGILQSCNWDAVRSLPTVAMVSRIPDNGTEISVQNRVTTGSFGMIFLGSDDVNLIKRDLDYIVELEMSGSIYRVL
jgi:Biotin carboxylase